MRTPLVIGVMLATLSGQVYGQQADSPRAEVQQSPDLCTAAVEGALLDVLRAEAELDRLSRPLEVDGVVVETQAQYDKRVRGEDSDLAKHLAMHVARFDLRGKLPPNSFFVADLIRFDAGFQAAQKLVGQRDFQHADVLNLFAPAFFDADPIWGTAEAVLYHTAQGAHGELAPLTNGSALAYLTFGLLYQDDYWAAESRDREEFLADLLARGFESQLVAAAVHKALGAPLAEPRSGSQKFGRGIAGPLATLRGKVGFTVIHEDVLVSDLATLMAIEELGLDSGKPDLPHVRAERDAAGLPALKLSPRAHLKHWLPMMLTVVREELYPGGAPEMMRHGKTMEERLSYWRDLFTKHGFIVGRERALEEIQSILTGVDQHPLSEKIDLLLAQKEAGGLTPEEQATLENLLQKRDADRHRLISSVVDLMAQTGALSHYDVLLLTLTDDLPQLLAETTAQLQARLLGNSWMLLSLSGQPRIGQTLIDYVSGDTGLPDYAPDKIIMGYAAVSEEQGQVALTAIVEMGSTRDVCFAICNGKWMTHELFATTTDSLMVEFDKAGASKSTRALIAHSTMTALIDQKDIGTARTQLIKILEAGRWADPELGRSWYRDLLDPATAGFTAERIHKLLSLKEIQDYKANGFMPAGVL